MIHLSTNIIELVRFVRHEKNSTLHLPGDEGFLSDNFGLAFFWGKVAVNAVWAKQASIHVVGKVCYGLFGVNNGVQRPLLYYKSPIPLNQFRRRYCYNE